MSGGINEAYINSLPSLNGSGKITLDLKCFTEFPLKNILYITVSARMISITGDGDVPERVAVFVNPAGNIIFLRTDKDGYEVKKVQDHWRIIGTDEVRQNFIDKTVKLPITGKLEFDTELGGWSARLSSGGGKSGKK